MKNFIIRTITAVFFVAAIVTCFLKPEAMILLFGLVTGLPSYHNMTESQHLSQYALQELMAMRLPWRASG